MNELYKSIHNIDLHILIFRPFLISIGFFLVLAAFILGGWGVQYAYKNIDAIKLSFVQAFLLLSLPSLGKYMPGRVFAFAGYSIMAKKFGIRISVSTFVNLLMMGFSLASASLIGFILLLFMKDIVDVSNLIYKVGAIFLMIIIAAMIINPFIYWKIINLVLGIMKQTPLVSQITSLNMAVLFTVMFFQNLLYLSGVVVMTSGAIEFSIYLFSTLLGIFCIANVAGFLAIFAPAGIGVREGVFLVMLTPMVGLETAGLITIMTRLIQTVCDCIFGVLGLTVMFVLNRTSS